MDPTIITTALIAAIAPIVVLFVNQYFADRRVASLAATVTTQQMVTQERVEATHKLVNSEMADFKAKMEELLRVAVIAAEARGNLAGAAGEKAKASAAIIAEQRGRDVARETPAPVPVTVIDEAVPVRITGKIA